MAKVTIVRPPLLVPMWSDSGPLTPPIGPAYLAASLRQAGHTARIVDGLGENPFQVTPLFDDKVMAIGLRSEEIVERIDPDTDLIGASCMFSQDWPEVRRLIGLLRRRFPSVPIVAGGEHVTAVPGFTLDTTPEIDACVLGEGEETIVDLAGAVDSGTSFEAVPGLRLRAESGDRRRLRVNGDDGTQATGTRQRIRSLDDLPWPAWDLVPIERYLDHRLGFGVNRGRSMPMLATRGCPYQCTFCSNPAMWTTRWYARDPEKVLDEIQSYRERYGASNFDFYDLTAIVRRSWILQFTRRILERGMTFTWQLPSGTRSEAIDGEVSRLLYASGCRNVSYAPESGSPEVLDRIKKVVKLDRLEDSATGAVRAGLNVKLNVIMGFPDESRRELGQTVKFLARMGLAGIHDASVSLFSPYPGSELYRELSTSARIPALSDEYFLGLGAYKDFAQSTSYSEGVAPRTLNRYRLLGILTFYAAQYVARPWRLLRLFGNLLRHRQESRLDKSLQDLLARLHNRRRTANGNGLAADSRRSPISSPAAVALSLLMVLAAALRFYGLAWGAPYYHFHIDEHFVFVGAERLRVGMRAAAESQKFFMYGPLPMHLLNGVVWLFQRIHPPLVLTAFHDQVIYMVMGRAISAAFGTATVFLAFLIGRRVSSPLGGILAAALLATTVIHIAESHSFRVDVTMLFFATLAWLFALRIAEEGRPRDYLVAGLAAGAAIGSKYSAAFIFGVVALAHVVNPRRPSAWNDARGWLQWTARGLSALAASVAVFVVVNPMAFLYFAKFRQDVQEQIVNPVVTGAVRPIFMAQFTDVQPQLYWLTTNFWWSFGPALEIWGLLGILWLVWPRGRVTAVAAGYPVLYMLTAAGTKTPMARYTLPLAPAFAVAAGAFSDALLRRPRLRAAAMAATAIVVAATGFYALAYMNIYRSTDARLAASSYLAANVPAGARVLVEPSHGIPPTGKYLETPNFYFDYVMWGARRERHDYYAMYTLDTYVYLYGDGASPAQKQQYITARLGLADFIVMDDFYVQLYEHLPADRYGVVRKYYDDLFAGRLGFDLIKTFKVYPSFLGVTINDDRAELSSRMNDHPRIYIFKRHHA